MLGRLPSHGRNLPGHFVPSQLEVLGQVVDNLRPVVRRALSPAAGSCMSRFDGVANILAVAFANLGKEGVDERWWSLEA